MKLHYYPETDSLYIEFKAGPGTQTHEVADGLNVDLDAAGDASASTLASQKLDLATTRRWRCPCGPRRSPDPRRSDRRSRRRPRRLGPRDAVAIPAPEPRPETGVIGEAGA